MFTRAIQVPVYPVVSRKGSGVYAVQEVSRMTGNHGLPRFADRKVTRVRAKAERVLLHMRTDGRRVRLLAR